MTEVRAQVIDGVACCPLCKEPLTEEQLVYFARVLAAEDMPYKAEFMFVHQLCADVKSLQKES